MKKFILILILIGTSEITFGQSFQKGNLLGFHVMTINLEPGVTFIQFKDFFNDKVIPELNRNFPGTRSYIVLENNGVDKNSLGMITVFESQENKDRYYNQDGSRTELGKSAWEMVDPIRNELYKLGKVTATYKDWIIQ